MTPLRSSLLFVAALFGLLGPASLAAQEQDADAMARELSNPTTPLSSVSFSQGPAFVAGQLISVNTSVSTWFCTCSV